MGDNFSVRAAHPSLLSNNFSMTAQTDGQLKPAICNAIIRAYCVISETPTVLGKSLKIYNWHAKLYKNLKETESDWFLKQDIQYIFSWSFLFV